jgi:uncharacterized protein involved in tolerance to divalent cations
MIGRQDVCVGVDELHLLSHELIVLRKNQNRFGRSSSFGRLAGGLGGCRRSSRHVASVYEWSKSIQRAQEHSRGEKESKWSNFAG